jgi:hypothetical protein
VHSVEFLQGRTENGQRPGRVVHRTSGQSGIGRWMRRDDQTQRCGGVPSLGGRGVGDLEERGVSWRRKKENTSPMYRISLAFVETARQN